MDEQRIRQIVSQEVKKILDRDYRSGAPDVPPHQHDGTANIPITQQSLGLTPVPQSLSKVTFNYNSSSNNVVTTNIETPTYGFGSPNILAPASATNLSQYVPNNFVNICPIPVVVGNGVGPQSAFNGGAAPDGTMVAFLTGSTLTSFLYIRFDGQWYGVNLSATPITP